MSLIQHLDKIDIFSAIVEAGSLGAASRRLSISQPALSQTLKTLEQAVGCQLIVRSRAGVQLTASGREFYEAALRILREAHQLQSTLARNSMFRTRTVRVGIIESIAIYAWPRAQEELRSLFASAGAEAIGYDLFTGRTEDILHRLTNGDVDFAVVIEPSVSSLFVREPLFDDSFFLYCAPGDPGREELESQRSKRERHCARPLFIFEGARIAPGKDLSSVLAEIGVSFSAVNHVDSFEVASEFVRAGLGFSLLPERVARKNTSSLHKLRIGGRPQSPVAPHTIYACAGQSQAIGLPFRLLCQAMRSS